MQRSLFGVYAQAPAIFLMSCLFGGMNELYLYIHCSRLYSRVFKCGITCREGGYVILGV